MNGHSKTTIPYSRDGFRTITTLGAVFCFCISLQLNSQGVYCSLSTGQEKREVPFATHVSCTIELANMRTEYEVAVVDEIQMLADGQRGRHWTAVRIP